MALQCGGGVSRGKQQEKNHEFFSLILSIMETLSYTEED